MANSLTLPRETMQAIGYRVVDLLVEHFATLPDQPLTLPASWAELESHLRESLPTDGSDPAALLDQLERDVFSHIMPLDHPRFFAFVPSPSNFISVMADALAAGFNVFAGTWLEASGPAE